MMDQICRERHVLLGWLFKARMNLRILKCQAPAACTYEIGSLRLWFV